MDQLWLTNEQVVSLTRRRTAEAQVKVKYPLHTFAVLKAVAEVTVDRNSMPRWAELPESK